MEDQLILLCVLCGLSGGSPLLSPQADGNGNGDGHGNERGRVACIRCA